MLLLPAIPGRGSAASLGPVQRWIVELSSPAAALAPSENQRKVPAGLAVPSPRFDSNSPAGRDAITRITAEQDRFAASLTRAIPASEVERRYAIVLNAVAVRAPAGSKATLEALPGVRSVTPDRPFQLLDAPDVEQLGAPVLWQQAGGPSSAGAGIKVAIIDSGIYTPHPSFNPAGYSYPPGFPKGDTRFTSPKVIVARSYFRPGDPPKNGDNTALPADGADSHGTHVAATVAGNHGVIATVDGVQTEISGVAPGAYLMNYRVFYPSESSSDFVSGNAFTVELVAALEDAVKDGADVVNNSWGASYNATFGWDDPMVKAVEATIAAGVVVVNAAGNAGPASATANSPADAPDVIAVGAVTTSSRIAAQSVALSGTGVPAEITRIGSSLAGFGQRLSNPSNPLPLALVQPGAERPGCEALPEGSLTGKVAVIGRGVCPFVDKALNAQNAGALGVLIVNTDDSALDNFGGQDRGVTVPVAMIGRTPGKLLTDWVTANPDTARIQFDPRPSIVPVAPDQIADFSSRGPTVDGMLKPDVVAPGVDIVSAGYGSGTNPLAGFGQVSGTSMASPHVAGSVALLRQLHPEWSPAQVKAALMTTANPAVSDGTGTPLGAIQRGAGRVDLARAVAPPFLASPPSLSFGSVTAGDSLTKTVTLTGSGPNASYQAALRFTGPEVESSVTPAQFSLGPGEIVQLTVRVASDKTTNPADYSADLELTAGDVTARVPLWVRVVPERDRNILLVDNDGSLGGELPNTAGVYRAALDALNIPYDIFDADEPPPGGGHGAPPLAALQRYKLVILFTGSRESPVSRNRIALTQVDQDIYADYLNGGGRLLAAGRLFDQATDVNFAMRDPLYGRSRLFHGYFGAVVRNEIDPPSSLTGVDGSPLAGKTFNLAATGKLSAVDVYREDSDTFFAPNTVDPVLKSGDTTLGLFRASEPAAGEPRREFLYRTALLGFGLEDVAEADRAPLLRALTDWLLADSKS